ncbi:MAG: alpha-amylase family protein [Cyclobacteriaceae bacterium]
MLKSKTFIRTALIFIIGAFWLVQCQPKQAASEKQSNSALTMNTRPIIYQVFTRLFGNTNTTNKKWGSVEENGVGKFNDFSNKALREINKMGITHMWYTGVIEHAVLTDYTEYGIPLDDADVVKGRAGSPYAIKDYYDVNPDLAENINERMQEFESLVKRTHKAGMKVLIDFVPNHVARNYASDAKPKDVVDLGENDDTDMAFAPNNNFYYIPEQAFVVPEEYEASSNFEYPNKDGFYREHPAKATGNDVFSAKPSIHDWFETVKLNYGVDYENDRAKHFDPIPDTWLKMKKILLFWASKDIDGFRCDMAEMVPVEFWDWAIKEVKAEYPNITFTAEIYNPNAYRDYIFTGGFDYLYDKVEMYDTLKHIIQGHASTDDITTIWQRQDGIGANMLRFLENHDEQRIASPYFAGDMNKGIPMMAVSAFMHKGPVMLYFGQEVGEPGEGESGFAGDDGRTTIFDYWSVRQHLKWVNEGKFDGGGLSDNQKALRSAYIQIMKACNEELALRDGEFYDLHYYNRNEDYTGYSNKVYTFVRHTSEQVLLVAVNFDEHEQQAKIKIPEPAWQTFGITSDEVSAVGNNEFSFSKSSTTGYSDESELSLTVPGMSYMILELNEK